MRILVFGGTTEGLLAHALAEAGQNVTVGVATPLGAEELGCAQRMRVLCGRLSAAQMKEMLEPFDLSWMRPIPTPQRSAPTFVPLAGAAAVPLRRVRRQASEIPAGSVVVPSAEGGGNLLEGTQGNVLLTTGAKRTARLFPAGAKQVVCARAA